MTFKIADLFPIRKGDLVKISEEHNDVCRLSNGHWENNCFIKGDDHPLFNKILLVLSEPRTTRLIAIGKVVDIFIQEDSEYSIVHVKAIERVLLSI